jgi:hypothetical protein
VGNPLRRRWNLVGRTATIEKMVAVMTSLSGEDASHSTGATVDVDAFKLASHVGQPITGCTVGAPREPGVERLSRQRRQLGHLDIDQSTNTVLICHGPRTIVKTLVSHRAVKQQQFYAPTDGDQPHRGWSGHLDYVMKSCHSH